MKNLIIIALILTSTTLTYAGGRFIASVGFKVGFGFDVKSDKVRGSIKKVGSDSFKAEKIKISVSKMLTDNEARDEHMKDRFNSRSIVIEKAIAKGGKGICILNMNGVKRKEAFTYKAKGKDMKIDMDVKLSDYKLKGISFKDIVLKDTVAIVAHIDIE